MVVPAPVNTVPSNNDLKSASLTGLTDGYTILRLYYNTPGDGGEGLFYWSSLSDETDDEFSIIRPSIAPPLGRWRLAMPDEVSPAIAGAVPNTDATTPLSKIAAFTGYNPLYAPTVPANPPDLVIDNVYQISGMGVQFKRSIKIRGTAKGLITYVPAATGISGSSFFQLSNYMDAGNNVDLNADVTLEDLTFQGQLGDFWVGSFSSGFSPVYPDQLVLCDNKGPNNTTVRRRNINVRGCKFIGGVIGFAASELADSTISDCIAEYQYYQGFGLSGQFDGLSITNCIARWTGNEGFKIGSTASTPSTGRSLKLIGNYAVGCGWLGLVQTATQRLSSTTEGFDCYWTSIDHFTITGNTADRCHDGGWEFKTARGATWPDPINETYSKGVVSDNTVILAADATGFQIKMEGEAPFAPSYMRDIVFSDNLVKYDYPSVYAALPAGPISTIGNTNVVTVAWPNHNARVGDIVMVRGMQPDSMSTTIGGIPPSAMFKFYPISAVAMDMSGVGTTISFVADAYASPPPAGTVAAGGGSYCFLLCWYADNRALPPNCMSVSGSSILVTYPTAHGCHNGDIVYIQGATGAVNSGGVPINQTINGRFVVSSVTSTTFKFTPWSTPSNSMPFGGVNASTFFQTAWDISTSPASTNTSFGTGSSGFLIWSSYGLSFRDNEILDGFIGYHLLCLSSSTSPAWLPATYYGKGATVQNRGNDYNCATAGTSAAMGATGPTGTTTFTDGGVTWTYSAISYPTWKANTGYKLNDLAQNLGNIYICRTPGHSASSGGPSTLGLMIPDNMVVWDFITFAWANPKFYRVNDLCFVGSQVYICTLGGVSGMTAPSGTGVGISDGVCQWTSVNGNNGAIAPFADIVDATIQGGRIRCQYGVFMDCQVMNSAIRNLTIQPGNWEFWTAGIYTNNAPYPYTVQNCVVRGGVLQDLTTFRGRGIDGVPNYPGTSAYAGPRTAGIQAVSWINSEISGVSVYSFKPINVVASSYGSIPNISQPPGPAIRIINCTLNSFFNSGYDPGSTVSLFLSPAVELDDTVAANQYCIQSNYVTVPAGTSYGSWTGSTPAAQVRSFGNVIGYSATAPMNAGTVNDLILCTNPALAQGWRCTLTGPAGTAVWQSY